MKDPQRRRDGFCARSGCRQRLTRPRRYQSGIDPAVYDADPFCSSTCCRIYYGLETAKERTCSGCGCVLEQRTDGCQTCMTRHAWRKWRKESRAEVAA